jgi:hypothetical protein
MRGRRCAFCLERAIVQCYGDRCIRQICRDHWWASAKLFFCPLCEVKARAAAAMPEQIVLIS